MTFGIGRDRNLERMPLLQPRNERGGILIAARMRLEACAFARRITAKRDDMAHPRCPILLGDRIDLGLGRLDTRQVRGGGERRLALDARARGVRALARRAARATEIGRASCRGRVCRYGSITV